MCRISPKCGATSIHSCSTAGIWATRATSRRPWRSTMPKALELFHSMEEVKQEAARFMKVKAVWQFFEAERDGNAIHLFAPGAPRPSTLFISAGSAARTACASAITFLPSEDGRARPSGDVRGDGRRRRPRALRGVRSRRASSSKRTRIQALAIETAEGAAEWLHRRIREDWGFPDPPTLTMHDRFTSKYRGKRYSFGYPACPNLDDQQGIWKLLQSGRYRRAADRGHDDGAGSERERAGFPPSRLRVLHSGRRPGGAGGFRG